MVAGSSGQGAAAEAGDLAPEVSTPKKPRVSVFDLLLQSGGKRGLGGRKGPAAADALSATLRTPVPEDAVDLL